MKDRHSRKSMWLLIIFGLLLAVAGWRILSLQNPSITDETPATANESDNATIIRVCGPTIDDWFAQEITNHWNFGLTQRSIIGNYWDFRTYAGSLLYRAWDFENNLGVAGVCPINCRANGQHSVTLCGTCIASSELGNIMFGIAANAWGLNRQAAETAANLVAWWQGNPVTPWDNRSINLGFNLGAAGAPWANGSQMCAAFTADPNWPGIQDPAVATCTSCTTHSVPANHSWHSTPGIPVTPPL